MKKAKTLQKQKKAVMFTENLVVLLLHQNRLLARKPALPDILPLSFQTNIDETLREWEF